jgi:hypothetical protein
VIYEAATSPEPRLRWLVGEDARLLVAGRQRMSDEEYVAGGRALPDDQYLEEIRQRFGFTWWAAAPEARRLSSPRGGSRSSALQGR